MKINNLVKFLVALFLGISIVNSTTMKNRVKLRESPEIRPNLGDIVQNVEHPFYENNFKPTEVKSLADILPKPKQNIYEMASAIILGDKTRNSDLDQKPSMYSTVIVSHPTSVVHPTKPIGNAIVSDAAAAEQFSNIEKKLPPGSFESPVKIQDLKLNEDGLKEMEKPVFISKGEKKSENSQIPMLQNTQKLSNTVENASNLDANTIKERLKGLKVAEREKRLKALQRARNDLEKESKQIKSSIEKETSKLLTAKNASISMDVIMKTYENRLKKDKLAHLKLADRVEIKRQLKNKLIKEIQGFRTRPSEFNELIKVDKDAIKNVVHSIKSQLDVTGAHSDQRVQRSEKKQKKRRY